MLLFSFSLAGWLAVHRQKESTKDSAQQAVRREKAAVAVAVEAMDRGYLGLPERGSFNQSMGKMGFHPYGKGRYLFFRSPRNEVVF